MRIIDSWSAHGMKVTIFHMSGKYSIKFETQLMEQSYKFRDGQFENIFEIKEVLTPELYKSILEQFKSMDRVKTQMNEPKDDNLDFDTII